MSIIHNIAQPLVPYWLDVITCKDEKDWHTITEDAVMLRASSSGPSLLYTQHTENNNIQMGLELFVIHLVTSFHLLIWNNRFNVVYYVDMFIYHHEFDIITKSSLPYDHPNLHINTYSVFSKLTRPDEWWCELCQYA